MTKTKLRSSRKASAARKALTSLQAIQPQPAHARMIWATQKKGRRK